MLSFHIDNRFEKLSSERYMSIMSVNLVVANKYDETLEISSMFNRNHLGKFLIYSTLSETIVHCLCRLMPIVGCARASVRRIVGSVVHSKLLYTTHT